jgi:hypothetical protein
VRLATAAFASLAPDAAADIGPACCRPHVVALPATGNVIEQGSLCGTWRHIVPSGGRPAVHAGAYVAGPRPVRAKCMDDRAGFTEVARRTPQRPIARIVPR